MRLSVFSPESSSQLLIDLQKLYQGYLSQQQLTPTALEELINPTNKKFFVTLFNARHLGAVEVIIQDNIAQLNLLCVRDITRRRGVGKNMLLEVEKYLQNNGVVTVSLQLAEIQKNEKAGMQLFMQSCGYQLTEGKLTKNI